MQGYDDHYPGGDKLGRDPVQLLEGVACACKLDAWVFCHLNSTTKQMIQQFKLLLGEH